MFCGVSQLNNTCKTTATLSIWPLDLDSMPMIDAETKESFSLYNHYLQFITVILPLSLLEAFCDNLSRN